MKTQTLLTQLVLIPLVFFISCTKEAPPAPAINTQGAPSAGAVPPPGAPGAINPVAGGPVTPPPPQMMVRLPYNIAPTDKQKVELEKIQKKYGDKLEAARKGVANSISDEQKRARMEAGMKARAAGKTGKDLVDAINNAAKLSPEQQKKLGAAQQELSQVSQEMNNEMMALLTPEQKEEIKKKAEEIRKNNPAIAGSNAPAKKVAPDAGKASTKKTTPAAAKHGAAKPK